MRNRRWGIGIVLLLLCTQFLPGSAQVEPKQTQSGFNVKEELARLNLRIAEVEQRLLLGRKAISAHEAARAAVESATEALDRAVARCGQIKLLQRVAEQEDRRSAKFLASRFQICSGEQKRLTLAISRTAIRDRLLEVDVNHIRSDLEELRKIRVELIKRAKFLDSLMGVITR